MQCVTGYPLCVHMAETTTALYSPSELYAQGVARRDWQEDVAQQALLPQLDRLWQELQSAPASAGLRGLWRGFHSTQRAVNGLYLWGWVGRGKTFLMDLLVRSLPEEQVERWHFHRFMAEVSAELQQLGEISNPLEKVADAYARRARVLCLDEFLVNDIGDAMLLAGLLQGLFNRGVSLVTTSNTRPQNLYRDGLQRARFEPAIALLQQHCVVLELASERDWRLRALRQAPTWLTPMGLEAERHLGQIFARLAQGGGKQDSDLRILGRTIPCRGLASQVSWFDFSALCDGPRSVADYIEIAQHYDAVLLSAVPQFTIESEDPALRFVRLVDEFYDRRVKLICSAATAIIDLYDGQRLRAEFARTESRLIEMQSEDYLAKEHRP